MKRNLTSIEETKVRLNCFSLSVYMVTLKYVRNSDGTDIYIYVYIYTYIYMCAYIYIFKTDFKEDANNFKE